MTSRDSKETVWALAGGCDLVNSGKYVRVSCREPRNPVTEETGPSRR